uniref:G-protein coupled receptors family 1 profile domain-containing protein n=1 Tax=Chelonoidis abingdonii TaxID=106734 RepID=A0A8C0H421_CHEAB
MAAFILTPSDPSTFILMGISGLEAAHIWISIPFAVFYIVGLLENITLLFVVSKEQTLHKPMYLLLCMLALTDIATPTSVVPKALYIFWFNLKGITVGGCLTQMFFLHTVAVIHSTILVTMAFDRYVAICNPLRYATILTKGRIAKLGFLDLIKAVLFILPMPLLLNTLPFCSNRREQEAGSQNLSRAGLILQKDTLLSSVRCKNIDTNTFQKGGTRTPLRQTHSSVTIGTRRSILKIRSGITA